MEHTLSAYLKRLQTDRLREFLRQYVCGELKEDYSYVIPYVQAELNRRSNEPDT